MATMLRLLVTLSLLNLGCCLVLNEKVHAEGNEMDVIPFPNENPPVVEEADVKQEAQEVVKVVKTAQKEENTALAAKDADGSAEAEETASETHGDGSEDQEEPVVAEEEETPAGVAGEPAFSEEILSDEDNKIKGCLAEGSSEKGSQGGSGFQVIGVQITNSWPDAGQNHTRSGHNLLHPQDNAGSSDEPTVDAPADAAVSAAAESEESDED